MADVETSSSKSKVNYNLLVEKLERCCAGTTSARHQHIIEPENSSHHGPSPTNSRGDHVPEEVDAADVVIPMAAYLEAYKQLHPFFCALGKMFDLVASEINSKVNVLESYLQDPESGGHYADVRRMLVYESANNLLRNPKKPSGSRTLLRLHRGLEFVYTLLESIVDLPSDHKISSKATEAYKSTLGKYHPWTIYYGMLVALKTLSTTKDLVKRTTDQSVDEFKTNTVPNIIRVGKRTHELVQDLYASMNCLDLP